MGILFRITDPMAELIRLLKDVRQGAASAPTQKSKAYADGKVGGLSQAIETLDMHQRYVNSGKADGGVELRDVNSIIEEFDQTNNGDSES